jgi:hypothetical protein
MKVWTPFLIAVLSVFVLSAAYGQTRPSPVPAAATALAMKSLTAIERSWVMPPSVKGESDCVMLGRDRSGPGDWRVLVLTGGAKPRVAWDSRSLQLDGYLHGKSADTVSVRDAQDEGYLITFKGCPPRRCYDGVFGYAVYVSRLRRAFVAQVTTILLNRNAFNYSIAYNPPAGIPEAYRNTLQLMICAESGISEPAKLPIKCPGR